MGRTRGREFSNSIGGEGGFAQRTNSKQKLPFATRQKNGERFLCGERGETTTSISQEGREIKNTPRKKLRLGARQKNRADRFRKNAKQVVPRFYISTLRLVFWWVAEKQNVNSLTPRDSNYPCVFGSTKKHGTRSGSHGSTCACIPGPDNHP